MKRPDEDLNDIDPAVNSVIDEATDETPYPWDPDAGFPDEADVEEDEE